MEERALCGPAARVDKPAGEPAPASRAEHVTVIRPAASWPHVDLPELWRYRELLATLVWRDINVRYKQTFLGVVWAIFQPVFTALIYIIVLGKFGKFPSGNLQYPVLTFSGLLQTQYFASALTQSSMSIVTNVNLVTKVYFPRLLMPLAAVLVPFVDFVIGSGVLIGIMAWFGVWPHSAVALLAPLFILLSMVTALGIGLALSAVNVRFRDVPYAIPVFMQVLPFVSGAVFAVDRVPQKWQWIMALNPVTSVISGWRWALLGSAPPDLAKLGLGVGVALVLLLCGLAYFRRSEPKFADTI